MYSVMYVSVSVRGINFCKQYIAKNNRWIFIKIDSRHCLHTTLEITNLWRRLHSRSPTFNHFSFISAKVEGILKYTLCNCNDSPGGWSAPLWVLLYLCNDCTDNQKYLIIIPYYDRPLLTPPREIIGVRSNVWNLYSGQIYTDVRVLLSWKRLSY